MLSNQSSKAHFKLRDVMRAAYGISMVDGGFVIAIQIISFLLGYFGTHLPTDQQDPTTFNLLNKPNFLIFFINMLLLSVIIYRIAGLARGIKYSPLVCFHNALRRWPLLIILYLFGSVIVLATAIPLLQILQHIFPSGNIQQSGILVFLFFSLIPYGILACVFVICLDKNPFQAIKGTVDLMFNKLSFSMLLNLSLLYGIPICLNTILNPTYAFKYIGLFNALWILFCHIITIVIHTGISMKSDPESNTPKNTKVIII